MIWETLSDDALSVVERAPYGDGHFVRMSWRHRRDIGVPPLEGSAVIYVPGAIPRQAPATPDYLGNQPIMECGDQLPATTLLNQPEAVDGEETEVA